MGGGRDGGRKGGREKRAIRGHGYFHQPSHMAYLEPPGGMNHVNRSQVIFVSEDQIHHW